MAAESAGAVNQLVTLMARLRSPQGCHWDRAQTFASLKPFLVEECCEVLDALDRQDYRKLAEELGDLLLQIVFQARLAEEAGLFTFAEVAAGIAEKLLRRHPHVFGEARAENPEQVLALWRRLKREEQGKDAAEEEIGAPHLLPALLRAQKVQSRAARLGFDWQNALGPLEQALAEVEEIRQAWLAGRTDSYEGEVGDLLFAAVNLARFLGVDAESALRGATHKFISRFRKMRDLARERGLEWDRLSQAAMDELWREVKMKSAEP